MKSGTRTGWTSRLWRSGASIKRLTNYPGDCSRRESDRRNPTGGSGKTPYWRSKKASISHYLRLDHSLARDAPIPAKIAAKPTQASGQALNLLRRPVICASESMAIRVTGSEGRLAMYMKIAGPPTNDTSITSKKRTRSGPNHRLRKNLISRRS